MATYEIKYENERGDYVDFNASDSLKALKFEGFGEVESEVQTQRAPYIDGSRFVDSVLTERLISIEFVISGNNYSEVTDIRRRLARTFNPKVPGKLTVLVDGRPFEILAVPEHVPTFLGGSGSQGNRFQLGTIDLIAPDPYWRDPYKVSRALRAYEGKFTLPTTFPIELGVSGDSTLLLNQGDVETPVTIDIQGPVTNPQVTNRTTGKFIRVNRSLSADEVLHIDTSNQSKRVEIYRNGKTIEKAMGYLDHYSDFWKLEVGLNDVQYMADAGENDAIVAIAWQSYYVGI